MNTDNLQNYPETNYIVVREDKASNLTLDKLDNNTLYSIFSEDNDEYFESPYFELENEIIINFFNNKLGSVINVIWNRTDWYQPIGVDSAIEIFISSLKLKRLEEKGIIHIDIVFTVQSV